MCSQKSSSHKKIMESQEIFRIDLFKFMFNGGSLKWRLQVFHYLCLWFYLEDLDFFFKETNICESLCGNIKWAFY